LIRGLNAFPRHKLRLGSGAPDPEHLNWQAGPVETILKIQDHLAALYPEQMAPRAGHIAFHKADGEDIDMPRRDLQSVAAVVEKLGVATVEHDMARRTVVPFPRGYGFHLLKQRFCHS
jgi:hypothetical protein